MSEKTTTANTPTNPKDEELVLVIPRSVMEHHGAFQGFRPATPGDLEAFFAPGVPSFLRRGDAEYNREFKQLIPYCVLTHKGKILTYSRGGSGGEKRLTSKLSIGFGGHINPVDATGGIHDLETYQNAVIRELDEELTFGKRTILAGSAGLINDDSNPVGEVHLGVVEILDLEHKEVTPNEDAIASPEFLSIEELRAQIERLETWSQIALDFVETILKNTGKI
jgi:predicted NUDIX family phosphoesterase